MNWLDWKELSVLQQKSGGVRSEQAINYDEITLEKEIILSFRSGEYKKSLPSQWEALMLQKPHSKFNAVNRFSVSMCEKNIDSYFYFILKAY